MSRGLLPALVVTAAVLAGLVAVELATGASRPALVRPAPAAAGASALQPATSLQEQVAALLARPPFSPHRKPEVLPGTDDPRLPHLTGILVTSQERKAIFAGRDGGRGAVVGPGDQIGAYRVQEISATDVTLAGADGAHTVHPTFSTAPPPIPAAAPLATLPLPQIQPPPAATLGIQGTASPNLNAFPAPGAGSPR